MSGHTMLPAHMHTKRVEMAGVCKQMAAETRPF